VLGSRNIYRSSLSLFFLLLQLTSSLRLARSQIHDTRSFEEKKERTRTEFDFSDGDTEPKEYETPVSGDVRQEDRFRDGVYPLSSLLVTRMSPRESILITPSPPSLLPLRLPSHSRRRR
jgi:hypothetical protein